MRVFDLVEMTPGSGSSGGSEARALGAVAGG